MTNANSFIFRSCRFEARESRLILDYGYRSGENFSEVIHFPERPDRFLDRGTACP